MGSGDVPRKPLQRTRSMRQRLSSMDDEPKDVVKHLVLSGALAGGVSKFCTAPIDRVKLMYQVSAHKTFSAASAARTVEKILRKDGFVALWRGNSVAVLRDVPYAAIIFSSYTLVEESICGSLGRQPDLWTRGAAGGVAGAIATFLTYPLDMLRARFGAEFGGPRYTSYYHGVREIVRTEGASALFLGLRPTLLGVMPYSALSFAAFETLKSMTVRWNLEHGGEANDGELLVRQKLAAGAAAGAFAQTSTYPLHVVRRRMQAGLSSEYTSTAHALASIYRTEGIVSGLFKGLTLGFVKGPLQSAIGFSVNDWCKRALRERQER